MSIREEVEKLEPGGIVRLWEIDATSIGASVMLIHGYANTGIITWKGEQYTPFPVKGENFARTSEQQPVPQLSVGNVDGSIGALCEYFEDMVGAKVTRRATLVKFLDAVNFPGGNPTANPAEEFPDEVWYIERKAIETATVVQFDLSSPLDFQNVMLPRRTILAKTCAWVTIGGYRGPNCGYTGPAVAKLDDTPTTNIALDRCGGRVKSCKMRFGADQPLPYGGFPAAGLLR